MPFGGRAGVHDVGDLAAVRVDPGQVVRARHVGPDRARRPGEIVQAEHPAARAADVDHRLRVQGPRLAPDEFAASVAGHDVSVGGADAPALAVVRHLVDQLERARVPAQGDAILPGQLPDDVVEPADALAEQLRRPGPTRCSTWPAPSWYRHSADSPYSPVDSHTIPSSVIRPWVNPRPGCATRRMTPARQVLSGSPPSASADRARPLVSRMRGRQSYSSRSRRCAGARAPVITGCGGPFPWSCNRRARVDRPPGTGRTGAATTAGRAAGCSMASAATTRS